MSSPGDVMDATQRLLAASSGLNGTLPAWLVALRAAGRDAFLAAGLPTLRLEDWKYTNVAALAQPEFTLARSADLDTSLLSAVPALGGPRLVFANGRCVSHAAAGAAIDGVFVGDLAQASAAIPDALRRHLGTHADLPRQPFVALNTAFLDQGAVVHIGRGREIAEPIEILFVAAPDTPTAAHPRVLVVLEPGARATVVERYVGSGEQSMFTNAVTEIALAESAAVRHVRIQDDSAAAFHIASVLVRQSASSHFASAAISLGAALARTEIQTWLDGAGAECDLDGLYVARGHQHVDHQTSIDHRVAHGTSRELYKGVLDGAATGVFSGKVIVRENAQKSDAQQMNKNLLLSDAATVDTKPQLEIFADDVKCSHGATIGRLDAAAMFYLRSRGIDAAEARDILIRAFADEMVERIPIPALREDLGRRIAARFEAMHPGAAGQGA